MKIIFICTKSITFNTFLKSQAEFFIQKGFKVEVACSDNENLDLKNSLNHKINFPSKIIDLFNLIKYFEVFSQINSLVKKNNSALFFTHTPIASHLFRTFTLFKKLKIIYFVHGFRFTSNTNIVKGFFLKLIEKVLSINTSIFITINKEDYNYTKYNLIRNNSCYKLNGVGLDLTSKNKIEITKKKIGKILVIAAYKKDKGYYEILKAAEILKNQKIQIVCYGYGSFSKFNSLKVKNKLKNITFRKFDPNLNKKIKRYDILLHLSKREGLPVSVMQCLLNGLPVICYNIRGNNDLIKNKFNGFFIDTYRDIPSIISYLNSEKIIFYQVKKNAQNSITKNFSKKKINIKIYKIFKKIVNDNKI